jgi:D-3-phosphoglycerate dehydrogenase
VSCWAASDVVTLHVPETEQTKNLIGLAQLARHEKGRPPRQRVARHRGRHRRAGRGAERGHLGGAAIDVFPRRTRAATTRSSSRRCARFDNVILTPHIGGSTVEAQANIGVEVADKLVRYSTTARPSRR